MDTRLTSTPFLGTMQLPSWLKAPFLIGELALYRELSGNKLLLANLESVGARFEVGIVRIWTGFACEEGVEVVRGDGVTLIDIFGLVGAGDGGEREGEEEGGEEGGDVHDDYRDSDRYVVWWSACCEVVLYLRDGIDLEGRKEVEVQGGSIWLAKDGNCSW